MRRLATGYWLPVRFLAPAYGQVPAEFAVGGFAEDALVLAEFGQNWSGFRAEGGGILREEVNEGAHRDETGGGVEPLGLRKMASPFGVSGALFEEERHGVLVGGEELEERADLEALGEALEGVLVARQGLAVDEDVEAGVFALHDDVETCRHFA